jgi:hypothetical protein
MTSGAGSFNVTARNFIQLPQAKLHRGPVAMSEKQLAHEDSVHMEANGNFDRSWREEKFGERQLSVVAHDNAIEEKDMTIRQALKIYKKAMLWSLAISCVVIMEGYDTNLLGNFYAYRVYSHQGRLYHSD